jgi:hypothetical protein
MPPNCLLRQLGALCNIGKFRSPAQEAQEILPSPPGMPQQCQSSRTSFTSKDLLRVSLRGRSSRPPLACLAGCNLAPFAVRLLATCTVRAAGLALACRARVPRCILGKSPVHQGCLIVKG